jgi:hypothetical protein
VLKRYRCLLRSKRPSGYKVERSDWTVCFSNRALSAPHDVINEAPVGAILASYVILSELGPLVLRAALFIIADWHKRRHGRPQHSGLETVQVRLVRR